MFRAPSATIGAIVAGVVGILLLGDAVLRAGWGQGLLLAPWVLLMGWLVWVLMYAPYIATDDEAITIANVLRRTRIPWGRVNAIDLRWQVVVELDDGRLVKAYGGPVAGRPGRLARAADARREPPALRELILIREPWEAARERGASGGAVERSWAVPELLALALILVWAAIALFIVSGGA